MASENIEEIRKRKRTHDTAESQQRTTKKAKNEGNKTQKNAQSVGNSVKSNGTSATPNGKLSGMDATSKQDKRKSRNSGRQESIDEAEHVEAETAQDNASTAEQSEKNTSDAAREARKLERKQRKLVKKFGNVAQKQRDGSAAEEKLHELLRSSKKFVRKHGLGLDNELVKLCDRYSGARRDLWQMSQPSGGRYSEQDLVFSKDERYILLATSDRIHIYEAESSSLVRTIRVEGIQCYELSASEPHQLYVGNATGSILRFDWTTGDRLGTIKAGKGRCIRSLAAVQIPDSQEEVVFTIEVLPKIKKQDAMKEVLTIRKPSDPASDQVLYKTIGSLRHLRIADGGKAVFVIDNDQMLIGSPPKSSDMSTNSSTSLTSQYQWRNLDSNHPIACLDVYSRLAAAEGSMRKQNREHQYDVAIGNIKGEILIFDDIVGQLERIENQGSKKTPHARMLRWHRQAPNAIKWSRDGNYLLSGGKETVLCLWQIETGRRQELPHLTGTIQNLVVSPSGTAYGIQLSDNSTIVMSTAELQPKALIAGLQSLYIGSSAENPKNLYTSTPLLNNPRNTKDLLLAVPVDQKIGIDTASAHAAPFLQTYDLQSARHITRQALTRNLITEVNIDPDWNKIEIPTVTHLQISHDGLWLSTVEEWMPPAHALQHLAFSQEEVEIERRKRRETYLKIWHWDEADKAWALNTRVDRPHADDSNEQANRTFHLAAHPTRAEFATIGEDSTAKIWRPRTRSSETSWFAKSVFKLDRSAAVADQASEFLLPASPIIARLAYSNDGSVLAVCQQSGTKSKGSIVQLLDADTGIVQSAETGLVSGCLVAMGFINRCLVLLSDQLRVWDAVIGSLVSSRIIGQPNSAQPHRTATTHLAVSLASGTYAVAGFDIAEGRSCSSVMVFKPTITEPLFTYHLDAGAVSALAPLVDGTGYVILDSLASLRTLKTHNVPILSGPSSRSNRAATKEAVDAGGDPKERDDEVAVQSSKALVSVARVEGDKQTLKSDQLAQVFAASSGGFGLPSVKEMFDSVAGLLTVKAA